MKCDLCGKETNATDIISYGDIDESWLCRSCYSKVSENTAFDKTSTSENVLLSDKIPSIVNCKSVNSLADRKLIYSIFVVLLYSAMLLESRFFLFFPDGNLSGRTLVVVFVIVTTLASIAAVYTFRSAFINNENKTINISVLLMLAAALSSASVYFISNNLLNFHQSIAYEINGVHDKQHPSPFHSANSLFLNKRGMFTVPTKIYELSELIILHLQGNQIANISPKIASMESLVELNLTGNQLSSLPNELSLLHLKYLHLASNMFVSFPKDFKFPVSLETLDLDHNRLTSLSNTIANCTSLKHLSLWGNQLSDLPEPLANLAQMESLSLQHNNFTEFPSVVIKLNKLTYLGLHGNRITNIPSEVSNMINLKALHLGGNPIPPEQIEKLRKNLPNCEITFK